MAMTYGSIDKSKDKRDKLELIISNLATVLGLLLARDGNVYEKNKVEQLLKDSIQIAQELKG
jgi:hypothetical protein